MDKLQKLVATFLSEKFEDWESVLTDNEKAVFSLFYLKGYSIVKIAQEINYSDRQVKRILQSARKKIYKVL